MLGIPPVVLLLPHLLGSNLRRIAYPQFEVELGEQALEPTRVPRGLHPHPHADSLFLQLAIELFGLPTAVCQPPPFALSSFRIHPGDLLHARVIIAAYNQHVRPPSSRALGRWHYQVYSGQGRPTTS